MHSDAGSYANLSLWFDQLGEFKSRSSLSSDTSADVAIIGGGFTGLWTAYYLKKNAPHLSVVLLESETIGYGASGRNGGWLMGELAGEDQFLAELSEENRQRAQSLVQNIPDEVARVIAHEGIECGYQKGGVLLVAARFPEQETWLREYYSEALSQSPSTTHLHWLDANEAKARIAMPTASAAVYNSHCARIQPAFLVRGLAEACERMGVQIFEHSPVVSWGVGQGSGKVRTAQATVKTKWVVPALEAYGVSIQRSPIRWQRYQRPVQSGIIATEPLSQEQWQSIGLVNGEVFSDFSRLVTYGQRSWDDRLVFGARGSYLWGAGLKRESSLTKTETHERHTLLLSLFPQLEGTKITHAWGGNLAIARRFRPHLVFSQAERFVLSAGYGGEGVGATNLMGRTMADLITGNTSELTTMPWVDCTGRFANSKAWEPEPIPWLGYKFNTLLAGYQDRMLSAGSGNVLRRRLTDSVYRWLESQMK